jgi:acetyl-CoA carboxylase biotin carboxylase subunit
VTSARGGAASPGVDAGATAEAGGPLRTVVVANRGEIAVRIIRACRDLGIGTIVTYSEADADSLAVRMADRAVRIGPPAAARSYLQADTILAAATALGADAIHPGYGFLAENAAFSAACEDAGVRFIGPRPRAVELMGNKVAARRLAGELGVPLIPGTTDPVSPEDARRVADEIGYPVLLKAAAGGGGRGMRLVSDPAQLEDVLAGASSEAQASFGDGSIYVEKYLGNARHIEIQVAFDAHGNGIHLGERDCTMQRRYQKLVEEAPSPAIDESTRTAMGDAALRLCREVDYRGVGTVEFLFDQDSGRFHFIEMNTRLQVEHPVTEEITGLDLVTLQLRVAAGEPLPLDQSSVHARGHAIEFRINAEDPELDFRPSAGRLERWSPPAGPGVRVDTHCTEGYAVPPYYDSLLAKLIVRGATRGEALARSRRALDEFVVAGVATTIPFHRWLVDQPDFGSSHTNTAWVERTWSRRG